MINKRLKQLLHIAFWAYMFLSPMQFMRGTGMPMIQYWMNCMSPLLLMVMFYTNYLWLTPHYFVAGKHRYFLMINTVMVAVFVVFLHYWSGYTNYIFHSNAPLFRWTDAIDEVIFYVRDFVNMVTFATGGTTIALASRWFWADNARKLAETARVKAEAARVTAELSNLRSQINPHFLLNTLNNIYALTAIDATRAQSAIQQLSKLLRHMLYDNQEQLVPLTDEVQFLENYVNLMKIRLSGNVDVRFDYTPADPVPKVAPLIAVSLIENAFKHGVSPTEPSFVHIRVAVEDTHVIIDIQNSNHPKNECDRSGHGIGLQQVQHRLDLSYSGRYEWRHGVSDDGKIYTSVIILETNP